MPDLSRRALNLLATCLERLCCLTHPFVRLEIWLTGRHCNLARFAFRLWQRIERMEEDG